jgi:hypothetical protein
MEITKKLSMEVLTNLNLMIKRLIIKPANKIIQRNSHKKVNERVA